MSHIIKVRCTGGAKHVNEVDLDKALTPSIVLRSWPQPARGIPERLVLPCQHCAEGQVILTRAMIEKRPSQP